ncbi:MAG: TRAP transporter TatT component family protein [Acidobacteriota bacterium]
MMSCILALYLALFSASVDARGGRLDSPFDPHRAPSEWLESLDARSHADGVSAGQPQEDPDALYAKRSDLASARQATNIWAARLLKNPRDFDAAWKLARARYWLGGHATEGERKELLEGGIAAGRTAVVVEPNRPEGHFWIAANMGALAESFGLRQGLKYRGDIRDELLAVLRIDPAFQQGSADRALGRWYYKVPGLFGGSAKKSEEHLRKSLTYNPNSTSSHYFLAETLLDAGRKEDARAEMQKVIDAPFDAEWGAEDREWKDKARQRLAEIH